MSNLLGMGSGLRLLEGSEVMISFVDDTDLYERYKVVAVDEIGSMLLLNVATQDDFWTPIVNVWRIRALAS